MKMQDFYRDLPAIWLVFAGSYLNHNNSPKNAFDDREKSLIDLLRQYLQTELSKPIMEKHYDGHISIHLNKILDLLTLWSEDLSLIYQIRSAHNNQLQIMQLAQRFLQRIRSFENCTLIPNGLISAKHNKSNENICLAILKRHANSIDWIQIDPGSAYHQHSQAITGEESCAYLKITEINPTSFNEDWLSLLVGLKAVKPNGYYKDVSLYECLLAQLNGKTTFKSKPDEFFVPYSHSSPAHTWQVIEQSIRYLLRHFIGENYFSTYWNVIIGFKVFLSEQTYTAYQAEANEQKQQCHYLLQEMCQHIAQLTLEHGHPKQIEHNLALITTIKAALNQCLEQQYQHTHARTKLDKPIITSLNFAPPLLADCTKESSSLKPFILQAEPIFTLPRMDEDIIEYLKEFKSSFIDRLINSDQVKDIALLCYGIEEFIISYLAKTTILEKAADSFSKDDAFLACILMEIAEIYYGCQGRVVKHFLSNKVYQPQFYAKNLAIQFFVYAAIASLNLRDGDIGPLLAQYNLSTSVAEKIEFNQMLSRLVIDDSRWLKIIFTIQSFFKPVTGIKMLFSHQRFINSRIEFEIDNLAVFNDTDVRFSYILLQKNYSKYCCFQNDFRELEAERDNQKWQALTYSNSYLPSLYCLLIQVAYIAKTALIGFRYSRNTNRISAKMSSQHHYQYWKTNINFQVNYDSVHIQIEPDKFLSYVLKKINSGYWSVDDPYQRLIVRKDKIDQSDAHYVENEIVASQDEKPIAMNKIRYLDLGFLQSVPLLKIERLYIAIKQQQLDFTSKQDAVLIKQTLFETSQLYKTQNGNYCLLEWVTIHNSNLIHQLGLLCVGKALAMKLRLTQHHAISEILEVVLGLLTFYPTDYKDALVSSLDELFILLQNATNQPPPHLGERTLLYLNAYIVICAQAKSVLTLKETLTLLTALLEIQTYKVKGFSLNNNVLLRTHVACFKLSPLITYQLEQDQALLNQLMLKVIPQWDQGNKWQKYKEGLLFICNGYTIEPLLGRICFQNQSISGLPDKIIAHPIYKDYFDKRCFAVIPSARKLQKNEVACYLSINCNPSVRLTLINKDLLIEEYIDENYQLYLPAQTLLNPTWHPKLLYQQPDNGTIYRHWLADDKILIKDQQRQTIYEWNLKHNALFSVRHQGYLIPCKQLKASFFKEFICRIEPLGWLELIAIQQIDIFDNEIKSLHFPRLALGFDYREGKFYSRQVHGYYLAEQQNLNTLHGFDHYLILEKQEPGTNLQQLKIIIPHRTISGRKHFYDKSVTASLDEVQIPSHFIYELNQRIGLLKANSIAAHLYLALLYYRTASFDEYDLSQCNAFHLAVENLEVCWKDQPYDATELGVIKQLLNKEIQSHLHYNLIAIYLKVISLLCGSLRLSFLHTSPNAVHNTEQSQKLLDECKKELPYFFALYLQSKARLFSRVKLSSKEEQDILGLMPQQDNPYSQQFCAYRQLYFEEKQTASLSSSSKKLYKDYYQQLFAREQFYNTCFLSLMVKYINYFKFNLANIDLKFSGTIKEILVERFRLEYFIPLYILAQSSISRSKYRYLLHHMVLRSKILKDTFPPPLVMMLARALLMVAENPEQFPKPDAWLYNKGVQIDLTKRKITKALVCQHFPNVLWSIDYEEALRKNENENERIWSRLANQDLDNNGIPLSLPYNQECFSLNYERNFSFIYSNKRGIVKHVYLEAARNNAVYQFLANVLKLCDQLKYTSNIGCKIEPCINSTINVIVTAEKSIVQSKNDIANLEKWIPPQQEAIDLNAFITTQQLPLKTMDYPFESQLEGPTYGYQKQFYSEFKDSWVAYQYEIEFDYQWQHESAAYQLAQVLQLKQVEIAKKANHIWHKIAEQLKYRTHSATDQHFWLSWYSGQASYYHKGDILFLLLVPDKLAHYNPSLASQQDAVIQDLLMYLIEEINQAKIIRALALIESYKYAKHESEKASLLHRLVNTLQETIDQASYRYPHWLLFQFENNLIVRPNQRELILAMLNQAEKAMYQLNMGEGKSSVILPLISNDLANGRQLLRINVLQPLLATMQNLLRQRFSGLIKKQIYTLPFYRNTPISTDNLTLILHTLKACQQDQHLLLITPEHRMCLQLKIRELMLENQQQFGANGIFNWQTYRQRTHHKAQAYHDLSPEQIKQLLIKQDEELRKCLINEKYIDKNDHILKIPPRGLGQKEFAKFKELINEPKFREWSCLKAAYRELLFNSKLAYSDSQVKLTLLHQINELIAIDLLDESDEILKHGTELNYTMGDKYLFAGGELRWQIPQFFIETIFCDKDIREKIVLGKIQGLTDINTTYAIPGGVPYIQLLNETYYENTIKPLLIEKFCTTYLPFFRKHNIKAEAPFKEGKEGSLRDYIAGQLSLASEKHIMAFLADKGQLKDILLIAKGWLSYGILFHVFHAKYRVKYGLDVKLNGQLNKMIAIPFLGKDSPSPRSEFSHPDVMLGFSIISYLYQGLNKQQLKEVLQKLKDKFTYQIADKYLRDWVESSRDWIKSQTEKFPTWLTSFENLDLSDEQCLTQVHQYLTGNYHAILFYLNQFILPDEAQQYRYKISANAHSLVGYNFALGFSGTDDRKITMPFQIKSLRSKTQQGTNGKLLHVLIQKRNSTYFSLQVENTTNLLQQLCGYVAKRLDCHALIDAGALVTGLSNYQVALVLLNELPDKFLGIIYFSDEGNNLNILTREHKIIALQDCHIDKQYLFAYLDDVHTRGTDIQLPLDCHGILTIGMGMHKDKLMQAAMRLRQLAHKQSVSLWGTHEITLTIARDNQIPASAVNSLEVIKWVTRNSITQINNDLFLVALRKINFQFLRKAEILLKEAPAMIETLVSYCQEKELFMLEDFYGLSPQLEDLGDRLYTIVTERVKIFWQELQQELASKQLENTVFYQKVFHSSTKQLFREELYAICHEIAVYLQQGHVQNALDNDQEKEVEVEIIQEQNVITKVDKRIPTQEKDWDVALITENNFLSLAKQQKIIMPIHEIMHYVQQLQQLKNINWHPDIYMTENYINSIAAHSNQAMDNYLRPVDAILVHRLIDKSICILLSGQEAGRIKSSFYQRHSNNLLVHLHDINGPTMLPIGSTVTKQEQKLLTIIKLFSGECHYPSAKETQRIAKRVGRIYPHYFINPEIDSHCSQKLYSLLIEHGYLDFAGVMTEKLLKILDNTHAPVKVALELNQELQHFSPHVSKKLWSVYNKLIIQPTISFKNNHYTLWQWVGTRSRLKDYPGSELETILNSDHQLKLVN